LDPPTARPPPHLGRCQHDFFTPNNAQFFATPPIEPAAYLYDGVVALALAMDAAATAKDAAQDGLGSPAASRINGSKLLTGLKELASFDGASGPIALDDKTGDREPATLQFALESFNSVLSEEPTMILAYNVSAKIFPVGDGPFSEIEMLATARNRLQWIDGDEQPEDAITNEVRGCLPKAPIPSMLQTLQCSKSLTHARKFSRPEHGSLSHNSKRKSAKRGRRRKRQPCTTG